LPICAALIISLPAAGRRKRSVNSDHRKLVAQSGIPGSNASAASWAIHLERFDPSERLMSGRGCQPLEGQPIINTLTTATAVKLPCKLSRAPRLACGPCTLPVTDRY